MSGRRSGQSQIAIPETPIAQSNKIKPEEITLPKADSLIRELAAASIAAQVMAIEPPPEYRPCNWNCSCPECKVGDCGNCTVGRMMGGGAWTLSN